MAAASNEARREGRPGGVMPSHWSAGTPVFATSLLSDLAPGLLGVASHAETWLCRRPTFAASSSWVSSSHSRTALTPFAVMAGV